MSSVPTTYLAGPVASLDDGGASWRETVMDERLQFNYEDPLEKYNVPLDDLEVVADDSTKRYRDNTVTVSEIVEGDKAKLRNSNAVLVGYENVHSIGTPMEVMWSYMHGYPVLLWVRDDTPRDKLSPWYRYHVSDIYTGNKPPSAERLATVFES